MTNITTSCHVQGLLVGSRREGIGAQVARPKITGECFSRAGLRRVALAALVAFAVIVWAPPEASALNVDESEGVEISWPAAPKCGEEAVTTGSLRLPHDLSRLKLRSKVGDKIMTNLRLEFAVITQLRFVREGGSAKATVTIRGSDAACDPARSSQVPTGRIDDFIFLDLFRRVKVYFSGLSNPKVRPPTLLLPDQSRIIRLRWSRWGGEKARGRGLHIRKRNGRTITSPVAVVLTTAGSCSPRYEYLEVTYRFLSGTRRGRQVSPIFHHCDD